ncbi:MAG: capsid protein [Candidatus Glassbacteria bacterium]|nr:capsid protein [Candidatus Glassbacteria bacterium]
MPEGNELQVNPTLTNVSIQYRPDGLIGDQVLPDFGVIKKQGDFKKYVKDDRFTIPDDVIGPKSEANEVEWTVDEDTYSCKDYGLDDFVSNDEQAQATGGPFNALIDATEFVTDLFMLAKEKRQADLVFAPGTYPAGNKVLLAGTSQWSDFANSDPLGDIETAKLAVWGNPNTLVFGAETWSMMRRHPDIIKSVIALGPLLDHRGLATLRGVAELFEMEQALVGRTRYNTAAKGQAASFSRLWGKHAAVLNIRRPSLRGLFFGANYLWTPPGQQARVAGTIPQPSRGLRGGVKVRVGETYVNKIVAADTGYFIEDAIA